MFSYIGYLRQELTVANTVSDLKVVLQPDVAGLEEAVVIGYGNQQRSKISGAVTTVDIKEATSIPVLRTEQALQGRAAGVQVTQNSVSPVPHRPSASVDWVRSTTRILCSSWTAFLLEASTT